VFGADIGMPHLLRRRDSQIQGIIGFFGKSFKNIQFANVTNKTFVSPKFVSKELIAPYGTLLHLLPFAL
jgi:hypothetical protein